MKTLKRVNFYMEESLLEEVNKISGTTISQFMRDAVCEKLGVVEVVQEQSEFRQMKAQLSKLAADVQRLEAEVKKVKPQPPGPSVSFAASQSIYVPQ